MVVSDHCREVASFDAGATTREMINATTRSRWRHAGPNSPGNPNVFAMANTAATWPWGRERSMSNPSPAATKRSPFKERRINSITSGGRCDRLARVSFLTLPSWR